MPSVVYHLWLMQFIPFTCVGYVICSATECGRTKTHQMWSGSSEPWGGRHGHWTPYSQYGTSAPLYAILQWPKGGRCELWSPGSQDAGGLFEGWIKSYLSDTRGTHSRLLPRGAPFKGFSSTTAGAGKVLWQTSSLWLVLSLLLSPLCFPWVFYILPAFHDSCL